MTSLKWGSVTGLLSYLPLSTIVDLRIALQYIQSLTTASGNKLFGSVVRALDYHPGGPGSNPGKRLEFFSAMLWSVCCGSNVVSNQTD